MRLGNVLVGGAVGLQPKRKFAGKHVTNFDNSWYFGKTGDLWVIAGILLRLLYSPTLNRCSRCFLTRQYGLEYKQSAIELATKFLTPGSVEHGASMPIEQKVAMIARDSAAHVATGKFKQKVAKSAKDVRENARDNNFAVDLRVPWRASVQIGTHPSARPVAAIFEAHHLKEKMNMPTCVHQSHGSIAGMSIAACRF